MSFSRKASVPIIAVLILALILSGCSKAAPPAAETAEEPLTKTDFLMGTVCTVKIFDNVPQKVLDKAFDKIKSIDARMSANVEKSEVISVNEASGIGYVKVSDETYFVISKGVQYGELTNGVFDIAIGPIVKLWNIGSDKARVPSPQEIKDNLPLVNYKDILLDDANKSVMLKKKGMKIDLGGIAKGYTADAVGEVLKENGVKHAIINLGGNILVMGGKPDGSKWRVGIQNPFEPRGDYIGIVGVADKTVVTSGIYERYFEQDGKRYHHMLNPADGYPFDNSLAAVTIITDKSVDADGLSTSLFGMGLDKGFEYAKTLKGVEVIFMTKNSEVYITDGLKDIFELTDPKFVLKEKQ